MAMSDAERAALSRPIWEALFGPDWARTVNVLHAATRGGAAIILDEATGRVPQGALPYIYDESVAVDEPDLTLQTNQEDLNRELLEGLAAPVTVTESDGAPSDAVKTLIFPNGTVTIDATLGTATMALQPFDALLELIAALSDPNADRILFWDDSAGAFAWLSPGTNLSITGTTLDASGGGGLTVSEGGTPLDTDIGTIDFDATAFNLTESPENEANVALNFGTGSGQPAEGNHTHGTGSGQQGDPPLWTRREMQIVKNAGAATRTDAAAPAQTSTGTLTSSDDADGPWMDHATTASSGNAVGLYSAGATAVRRDWLPDFLVTHKGVDTTDVRMWVGLFSADPNASSAPSTHYAAFRYATDVDGTAFWRCVTDNGSGTPTVTTTAIAYDTTARRLLIVCSASDVKFYVDGTLVATHTTTLPTATTMLGFYTRLTTLAASIKHYKWGRMALRHV